MRDVRATGLGQFGVQVNPRLFDLLEARPSLGLGLLGIPLAVCLVALLANAREFLAFVLVEMLRVKRILHATFDAGL